MISRSSPLSATEWRVLIYPLVACCLATVLARVRVQGGAGRKPDEFKLGAGLGGGYTTKPGLRSGTKISSGDSIPDLRAGLMQRKSGPRTEWSARLERSR